MTLVTLDIPRSKPEKKVTVPVQLDQESYDALMAHKEATGGEEHGDSVSYSINRIVWERLNPDLATAERQHAAKRHKTVQPRGKKSQRVNGAASAQKAGSANA